jgi:hypothetical protein
MGLGFRGGEMKALTLWQPWASLVAAGLKQYETRHWQPPKSLIGCNIAIHAAMHWSKEEWRITNDLMRRYPVVKQLFDPTDKGEFTIIRGAVLVAVRLVACIPSEELIHVISEQEKAFGNYGAKRYGWKLEIVKIPPNGPIPAKGGQGFWDWHPDKA